MKMNLVFNELYLFSPQEHVAKMISFSNGVNVVTSSQEDGTDRGKSIILRSLYHALGANACFDTQWRLTPKVYILKFTIDDSVFYIYRAGNLFKLFSIDKILLFSVAHTSDLSSKLEKLTGFAVRLPNRTNNTLEITPPVYNFLPFFIDQDHYDGSKFSSFENLGQYSNYKERVMYTHFGVFNQEYFNLVKEKEDLVGEIKRIDKRLLMLEALWSDIDSKLGNNTYCGSLEILEIELNQHQHKYSEIMSKLNECKSSLIDLRNNAYDLQKLLESIDDTQKTNEKEINILCQHRCPECNSVLTDTVKLRSKRFNLTEDIILIRSELEASLRLVDEDIQKKELQYKDLLEDVHKFEERMSINSANINDILRYKGLCTIRDEIIAEQDIIKKQHDTVLNRQSEVDKKLKKNSEHKKETTKRYIELLSSDRNIFNIEEINIEQLNKITSNFTGSGSNNNIATIIWHMAIIKVRNEFNSSAVRYPLIIDSPNNVETDDKKNNKFCSIFLINLLLSHS